MRYNVKWINHHTGESGNFDQIMSQEERDLQITFGHVSDSKLIERWNSQATSKITGLQWIYTLLPPLQESAPVKKVSIHGKRPQETALQWGRLG